MIKQGVMVGLLVKSHAVAEYSLTGAVDSDSVHLLVNTTNTHSSISYIPTAML